MSLSLRILNEQIDAKQEALLAKIKRVNAGRRAEHEAIELYREKAVSHRAPAWFLAMVDEALAGNEDSLRAVRAGMSIPF